MEKSFCIIKPNDGDQYFILSEEDNDGLRLVVTDGINSWRGEVTEDYMKSMCKKIRTKYEEYVTQTKAALTGTNSGNLNFVYETNKSGKELELTWKKHIIKDDIKVQLGKIALKEVSNPTTTIISIFNYIIEYKEYSQEEIKNANIKCKRLASERVNALKQLEKAVKAKADIEQDLYSKFTAVLNSKKDKLKELKDGGGDGDVNGERGKGISRKKRHAALSDSSNEEIDTDDEKSQETQRKQQNSSAQDSLVLEDSPEASTSTAKSRRRRGNAKKATPSKPALPKSSSGKKTPRSSTSRTSSIRSQPTDDADADDLMEFM